VTGSNQLVTQLSMYTHCMLYCSMMAVYHSMATLTYNCMLHPIRATFSPPDDFELRILGQSVGGCIGSVAVDNVACVFLLCDDT
jgi:hypothetical protein